MRRRKMNFNGIKQIGIVGGGTSALMLCIEAAKAGIKTSLLDPKVGCIGSQLASEHIISAITNESIQKLSLRCDVVIFNRKLDFELNVKLHAKTYPSKDAMNDLCHFKNIQDILEVLEIPAPKIYYQDNKQQAFMQMEDLQMPFKFIKQYEDHTEELTVYNKDDLADFILEVDEGADSFILQPMTEYSRMITFLCIADENDKCYVYDPIEEKMENQECHMKIIDDLSKTMVARLNRYNKKLLKELRGIGAFTIKYGIKANKSVELIEITPELSVSGLLTLEAYELSIYEQYLHLVLGMSVHKPELEAYVQGTVKPVKEQKEEKGIYHFYHLGQNQLYIKREIEEPKA